MRAFGRRGLSVHLARASDRAVRGVCERFGSADLQIPTVLSPRAYRFQWKPQSSTSPLHHVLPCEVMMYACPFLASWSPHLGVRSVSRVLPHQALLEVRAAVGSVPAAVPARGQPPGLRDEDRAIAPPEEAVEGGSPSTKQVNSEAKTNQKRYATRAHTFFSNKKNKTFPRIGRKARISWPG